MGTLNSVTIIGHLGADPELKYTPSNQPVCNLSVATNESYKDKTGAKVERTEWHRVTVWGNTAESCAKYLGKGRTVCVQGRLQTRKYEKDGQTRYSTEIVADRVVFLDKASGSSTAAEPDTSFDHGANVGPKNNNTEVEGW